jgi:hypothetical protein
LVINNKHPCDLRFALARRKNPDFWRLLVGTRPALSARCPIRAQDPTAFGCRASATAIFDLLHQHKRQTKKNEERRKRGLWTLKQGRPVKNRRRSRAVRPTLPASGVARIISTHHIIEQGPRTGPAHATWEPPSLTGTSLLRPFQVAPCLLFEPTPPPRPSRVLKPSATSPEQGQRYLRFFVADHSRKPTKSAPPAALSISVNCSIAAYLS